jgi:hypothetical protein
MRGDAAQLGAHPLAQHTIVGPSGTHPRTQFGGCAAKAITKIAARGAGGIARLAPSPGHFVSEQSTAPVAAVGVEEKHQAGSQAGTQK